MPRIEPPEKEKLDIYALIKLQESLTDRDEEEEWFTPLDLSKFPKVEYIHHSDTEKGNYKVLKNLSTVLKKVYLLHPSTDLSKVMVVLYYDYGFLKKNELSKYKTKDGVALKCKIKLFNKNLSLLAEIPMLNASSFTESPVKTEKQLFFGLLTDLKRNRLYYYHIEAYNQTGKLVGASPLRKIGKVVKTINDPLFVLSTSDLHGGNGAFFRRGKVWCFKQRNNPRLKKFFEAIAYDRSLVTFKEGYSLMTCSGDHTDNASYDEYWADLFEVGSSVLSRLPLLSAIGNHDYYNGGIWRGHLLGGFNRTSKHFHQYLHFPREKGKEGHYYSVNIGNVHLIFLDSVGKNWGNESIDCDSLQWQWLEYDLSLWRKSINKGGPEFCFVYLHSAIFSLGFYGRSKNNSDARAQKYLTTLFRKYGVNIAFFGHFHAYQRSQWKETQYIQSGISGKRGYNLKEELAKDVSYTIHRLLEGERSRGYGVFYVPPNQSTMTKDDQKKFDAFLEKVKDTLMSHDLEKYFNVELLQTNLTNEDFRQDAILKLDFVENEIIPNLKKCVWWRYYNLEGELLDQAFFEKLTEKYDQNGHKTYQINCPEDLIR